MVSKKGSQMNRWIMTAKVRLRYLYCSAGTLDWPCVQNGPFHMPRTPVKTQVGPPLGLSRRRAEGRACISGPGTPNRNRRPAEGAQSVDSFRSADTGLPAGPHFA